LLHYAAIHLAVLAQPRRQPPQTARGRGITPAVVSLLTLGALSLGVLGLVWINHEALHLVVFMACASASASVLSLAWLGWRGGVAGGWAGSAGGGAGHHGAPPCPRVMEQSRQGNLLQAKERRYDDTTKAREAHRHGEPRARRPIVPGVGGPERRRKNDQGRAPC